MMTVSMKKMQTPDSPAAWPNGIVCSHCGRRLKPGQAVLAGRHRVQGSMAFHRSCITRLVTENWPETFFDKVREEILANPDKVFANQQGVCNGTEGT